MRSILLPAILIFSLCAIAKAQAAPPASAPARTLADLESLTPKANGDRTLQFQLATDVARLINSGALKTSDDFLRASRVLGLCGAEFPVVRMRHELLLAAAAGANRDAEALLPQSWDSLVLSLGRPLRFDVYNSSAKFPDIYTLDPAPKIIQDIWRNPDAARAAAKSAKENPELESIVKADQAIRNKDWSKMTEADFRALGVEDRGRNLRTREIIAAGSFHSPRDFANAALVMQHSTNFAGFELAHELAVCSMLLGERSFGRQTVTASYDRMLHSSGHAERFATPPEGIPLYTDGTGICDAERIILDCQNFTPAATAPSTLR